MQRDKDLDLYIEGVQKYVIRAYKSHKPGPHKLAKKEREALQAVGRREDIAIKPADKGGGIVVLNTSDYMEEGNSTTERRYLLQAR